MGSVGPRFQTNHEEQIDGFKRIIGVTDVDSSPAG
jgi:hypothetical protein